MSSCFLLWVSLHRGNSLRWHHHSLVARQHIRDEQSTLVVAVALIHLGDWESRHPRINVRYGLLEVRRQDGTIRSRDEEGLLGEVFSLHLHKEP